MEKDLHRKRKRRHPHTSTKASLQQEQRAKYKLRSNKQVHKHTSTHTLCAKACVAMSSTIPDDEKEDSTMVRTLEAVSLNNNNEAAAEGIKRGTVKRDALRTNERAVQQAWEEARIYQSDGGGGEGGEQREHFLVTFPYPYMNGVLHIGHAFSLTKAVFRAQYERHMGKNVLFPFAFHCTGMPIQAVRTN